MPAERLPMRHLREPLRLRHAGLPQHVIARSLGLGQGTVSKYLSRARQAGLSWPLSPDLDQDERLEALLFPPPPDLPAELRPKPDWAEVHRELRRPDVTLTLLWEEYKARARRLHLLVVLRPLQGVGRPSQADAAPGPCRRREALRRLRRPHHAGD